jgi:hypothetical protein
MVLFHINGMILLYAWFDEYNGSIFYLVGEGNR